jgi:ribosomal protein S27AE
MHDESEENPLTGIPEYPERSLVCNECSNRIAGRTEEPMEKYGVDEHIDQEKLEKQASQGCPKCGGEVTRHGNILVCKNCGTEPFEQESANGG